MRFSAWHATTARSQAAVGVHSPPVSLEILTEPQQREAQVHHPVADLLGTHTSPAFA